MTDDNPLSAYGWSNDDYDTTIGALVGEAGDHARGQVRVNEMAGILDVAENRRSSARSGGGQFRTGSSNPTLADIFNAPRQFDAVTRRGNDAHQNYQTGRRAARDEAYLASLTPAQREKVEAAKQAALAIASRELRGISRNATITSSARAGVAPSQRRVHNAEGLRTATRLGGTNFYGRGHNRNLTQEQAVSIANQRDRTAAARTRAPVDTPLERNLGGMTASRQDYSQFGPQGTPRENIPADERPAYSPSSLDYGPDFSSPPSQTRGAVTDPYGFSNVDTAAEATTGSFSVYGPNAFGGLDEAPVDYGQTYPDISAGLYSNEAVPITNEDFNAIFGDMPESESTGAVRGGSSASRASNRGASTASQVIDPYSFSSLQSWAPAPDAATIAGDVTGYGAGGAFSSRAPSTTFDFADIVNDAFGPSTGMTADVPADQAVVSGAALTEAPVETGRTYPEISSGLYGGPAVTADTSPFSPTSLGGTQGFGDYGNFDVFNNPVGYSATEFSQAPNIAPASQSSTRGVTGTTEKTITRDVPNPAWSEWSRDYGTKNALQDAWLAADEDKFGVERTPVSPPPPPEPPRTISTTTTTRSPVYGDVPAATSKATAATLPATTTRATSTAKPTTTTAPVTTAPVTGNWLDSLLGSLGSLFSGSGGLSLAELGGPSVNIGSGWGAAGVEGTGAGGGISGGFTGGDAGYGSDVRSGREGGYGNLYS